MEDNYESDDGYGSTESFIDEEAMNYDVNLLVDDRVDEFGESRSPQENYVVLKEEEIARLQDTHIAEVSNVLSISKSDACLLLPYFHWRVEELQDEWFADEEKVREKAGLLKKPIVVHNARANLKIPCGICFEEYNYDRFILSTSCGHPFCRDCWACYISTTICNGGMACLRLRCPEPSCSAAVGLDLVEKVLLDTNRRADHAKYKTYLLRSYVEDQKKIKWCPTPDCNCAIRFDSFGGMVSYDVSCLCSHSYCWNCTEENHRPVDCETVGKWILKNNDDSQNAQWILVNSKPCPKCKRPIEKNQGCNHMTCRYPCRHQFCWLCLGPHYNYKGCYCNSFRRGSVDNTPETSTDINENARKKAKLYLERYIHYYERWENNGRSKRKALEDFDKVKTEHIKLLGEIQGNTKEHEYDFLIEAWQQIIECRQVLRWTYAYGFYMPEDALSKIHLFEFLQGHAEFSLERLHNCAESELQPFLAVSSSSSSSSSSSTIDNFKDFKTKLVGLTKVTGTYFKRLITALEEGLPETSRYGDGAAYEETKWTCDRCTFINEGSAVSCAVCSDENPQGYWSCNRCTLLNTRPLNGHMQGSGGGDVSGVEIDKIHESHSVEIQQVKIESSGGNIHTHINGPAHTVASSLPAKVIPVGEFAVIDGEDLMNSDKDELKLEESVENIFHDIAQVGIVDRNRVHAMGQAELNGGQEMEVNNQFNDAEHGQLVSGNGQNSTIEKACTNSVGKDQNLTIEQSLNDNITTNVAQSKANVVHEVEVTEADMDRLYGDRQDMEVERDVIQEAMQPESSEIVPQLRYELPQKNEGTFSVSDLVWGKVKSHPWWPGQIFDFMAASEKAMKHHKKDCFLVAYFGDRTFAWNEVSSLKPFQSYFSEAQKQCTSETFHKAVNCVLEEVSRRVELGLSCSCIPKDVYEKIRFQIVENAGICRESSRVEGVDESSSASSFESDKLLKYVKALARFPSGGSDKLELVIAKAHLMSFFRLKGYCSLPEFQFFGELLESKTDNSHSGDKTCLGGISEHATSIGKDDKKTGPEVDEPKSSSSHKRKHNLREGAYAKMKERSMLELMGGEIGLQDDNDWLDVKASPSSGKRRKGAEYQVAELATQDGRKAVSHSAVLNKKPIPKPSFKIGECIQRAASQLSGSTIVKSSSDRPAVQGSDVPSQSSDDTVRGVNNTTKYSSLDELLSQVRLAAEEPLKEYNSLSTIVNFFSDFRNSVAVGQKSGVVLSVVDKVGGKKRKSNSVLGLPETFEFDDMNDTYWTDMVIQNGGEEQPPRKRKPRYQPVVLGQPEKPPQVSRRPYTRKKFSQGNQDLPPEKPVGYVDENAPAELVMSFSEVSSIPSETNLNKMFKRFGPLKEYETEVDRESSRARVVFKRCSDAEVACNSAGKFNIFGQITVSYQLNYTPSQLNYTPSITFGASTSAAAEDQEVQLVFPSHDHEMHLDLSTHDQMQLDLSTHDQMQLDLSAHDHMQLDLSTHDEMQLDLSTFEVNLV